MGFYFDPTNFGLGFGAGVLSSLAGYRAVQAVRRMGAAQERRIRGSARAYAQRSGNRRYLAELVDLAERSHLAGQRVNLTDILVEPRFIRMPDIISPPEEDVERNVFENVPTLHDYPYLHAPFNLPTLSIGDLGKGEPLIALLGLPGSGRSTALFSIALWSMGKLEFKPPLDVVQAQLDAEEEELSVEERAERIKDRVRIAQQSRERLARGKGESSDSEIVSDLERSRLRSLLPFYCHLANVNLRETASGSTDPAEPLARALQAHAGRIAAKAVPGELYRALQHKRALVLLDGYDEVPEEDQAQIRAWLSALLDQYGENYFIITSTPYAYHWMVDLGVVPVFLRPWNDESVRQSAIKWAQHWPRLMPDASPVPEHLSAEMPLYARAESALETTMHIWAAYAEEPDSPASRMAFVLSMLIPDYDDWLPHLQRMAALQLDEGYITLRRLTQLDALAPLPIPGATKAEAEQIIESAESSPWVGEPEDVPTPANDDDALFRVLPIASDSGEPAEAAAERTDEKSSKVKRSRRQASQAQARLLRILIDAGIVRRYRGEHYLFAQPQVAAYLAAGTVYEAAPEHLLHKAALPRWDAALAYASASADLEPVLRERLKRTPDINVEYLLGMTRWLRYAQADSAWRTHLLRLLGNMLVAPNQFSVTRERIAAALIGTRDDGTLVIFRRMVQDANPELRRLGCIGLGALRDQSAVPILQKFIQQDTDDVKIAAALALGAIGDERALEAMAAIMVSSENRAVRRIIAETLAADPEQGYPTLYDAIREGSDIMLRRSALFGLARVKTPWALVIINEVLNNPREEYFVRSAAEEVFRQIYEEELQGAQGYPPLGSLPWLLEWATRLSKEGRIDVNLSGLDLVLLALEQEEDLMVRLLATITAGQLGIPQATGHLYQALNHQEPAIRDSAYRALTEMQQQYGVVLPAPA